MMSKDKIIISKAHESDIAEILRLQRLAYKSEAEIYNNYAIQPLTQTFEQALVEFSDSYVLKAVIDNEIIGSVRAFEKDNIAHIGKLMVLPGYQNKGIGKLLLHAIETEFQGRRFELFTGSKSEKNIALYKKSGYIVFKTKEAAPGLTFVYMEKHPVYIREITIAEYPILEDFLYNAVFIPPGEEMPPREIIFEPEIYIYIKDFGADSDCGVIAEQDSVIIGAAWTRIIPAYGHIDNDTPELAISVLPDYRGRNIGTMMMKKLFELLYKRGYKRTSLSVQQDNPAVNFYKRLGYEITDEKLDHAGHEDYIMLKCLTGGN